MNPSIATSIGSIKSCSYENGKPNSMCMSSLGLIVNLSRDGFLYYCNGRQQSEGQSKLFPLQGGQEGFSTFNFSHSQFNTDGSMLLVWSKTHVGVVEIPRNSTPGENECLFYVVGKSDTIGVPNRPVIHAAFYPYSNSHIVVLFQGCIEIFDLILCSSQRIPLNVEHTFISFCFGPTIDWMALSILLVESAGAVFLLSPVLPRAARLPLQLIENLQDWVDEQRVHPKSKSSAAFQSYLDAVKMYLFSIGVEQCSDGIVNVAGGYGALPTMISSTKTTSFSTQAGISPKKLILSDDSSEVVSIDSLACLQGPCPVVGRGGVKGQTRKTACDICVPGARNPSMQTASPVAVVSYSDGSVDVLVLSIDDDYSLGLSCVHPKWINPDLESDELQYACPAPTLLWMESIHVPIQNDLIIPKDNWMLEADPGIYRVYGRVKFIFLL